MLFLGLIVTTVFGYKDGFVYTNGNQFMLNGKPYYFAGANCYNLFTFGSGKSNDTETHYMNKTEIDTHFYNMAANGVKVVRTWGFSTESWYINLYFL